MEQDNTLTFALGGDVTLRDFSNAILRFKDIISGLKEDVAPDSEIEWIIDELKASSAIAKIKGVPTISDDLQAIRNIKDAYLDVGRKVVHGENLTYNNTVVDAVTKLRKLINGRITSIRFETTEKKYTIKRHTIFIPTKTYWDTETFGCIRGRVQSISDRQFLHFTLYDYNDDHPITCYLPDIQKEKMRNIWGKLVYVEGIVQRNEDNDLATSISNISKIDIIKEREPKEWRKALGCLR